MHLRDNLVGLWAHPSGMDLACLAVPCSGASAAVGTQIRPLKW